MQEKKNMLTYLPHLAYHSVMRSKIKYRYKDRISRCQMGDDQICARGAIDDHMKSLVILQLKICVNSGQIGTQWPKTVEKQWPTYCGGGASDKQVVRQTFLVFCS